MFLLFVMNFVSLLSLPSKFRHPAGTFSSFRDAQFLKALSFIYSIPSGRLICLRQTQSWNAATPMDLTVSGNWMVSMDAHPRNAHFSIETIASDKYICFSEEQSLKTESRRTSTLTGSLPSLGLCNPERRTYLYSIFHHAILYLLSVCSP